MSCITARRICDLKSFCQSEVARRWEKFLRIFKGLFSKSPLKQGLERSSNSLRKTKEKARQCRAFCVHYMLGLSAPNPDTKDFSGKVLWNLKNFAKIKWGGWCKVLLPTFLRKKSRFERKFFGLPFFQER